jgi:hypothetical protein
MPAARRSSTATLAALNPHRLSDTAVTWSVNPAIDKQKGQVPSRKIASDLIGGLWGNDGTSNRQGSERNMPATAAAMKM